MMKLMAATLVKNFVVYSFMDVLSPRPFIYTLIHLNLSPVKTRWQNSEPTPS